MPLLLSKLGSQNSQKEKLTHSGSLERAMVESMFHIYFSADFMRYVGALAGLSIGFFLKYQIDKKYVFN